MGVSVGDCLVVLIDVGRPSLKVGSTLPWFGVLDSRVEKASQVLRLYIFMSLFLTVTVISCFRFLP